jgi:hypothetical protein
MLRWTTVINFELKILHKKYLNSLALKNIKKTNSSHKKLLKILQSNVINLIRELFSLWYVVGNSAKVRTFLEIYAEVFLW